MTVCQIVRGGLVGRNLESCVFSWSNSSSISSLWLELATGSVSERVLTMCWFSFLKSPSSTHTFFLHARTSWHPRAPTFIWWSLSFSSRISRGAFIMSLILGATLDYRVTSRTSSRNKPISFSVSLFAKTSWKYLGCGTLKRS